MNSWNKKEAQKKWSNNKTWTTKEKNDLKILYDEGYRSQEIANILNEKYHNNNEVRNKLNIRRKASKMGIRSKLYRKEVNGLFYGRHCNECKTEDSFRSNKSNLKHGIASPCKSCEREYKKKERIKEKYGDIWDKFSKMKEETND